MAEGQEAARDLPMRFERVPFVLFSSIVANANATFTFADSDLRNDSGFDYEIHEVSFHVGTQEGGTSPSGANTPAAWAVKITDMSRNIPWQRTYVWVSSLVDDMGSGDLGTKWRLKQPTVIPANGSLRVEVQNNTSPLVAISPRVAFIGFLLVPIIAGTRFDEATQHSVHAVPVR